MRLILALVVLSCTASGAASAQCACASPDPYAKLTPEEHRAKFDAVLQAASTAYARMMAAVRAGNASRAKEEARGLVTAWGEVSSGFWMRPPKGLEQPDAWAKWFPLAHERLVKGTQLVLSADDLKGARKALEGGRWALVRLREENNAVGLPDLVLRARGVQEEIRQALAGRNAARLQASCRRLDGFVEAATRMPAPSFTTEWSARARVLIAAPSRDALSAASTAANRLDRDLGDRLN